ncbi:Ribbon-helix-helix protein, copG family [Amycolatopsis xylanica]|uniref:Ribbon-helix-helix protein, copG family n=1 Tax=Amycolatopsis xylanica TaxID=589385 RepID=A0A1H2ZKB2_9PSEU|nr:ribbon-helix-helix protein, CopG family [Amycolatopsis xylanica]SDX17836.1 Ribbon-helix-helix protein, copG family [Amycolatopsis xylanica]
MTEAADRARRRAIRAEYAEEEAEAGEAEALENAQTVLSVRIPKQLAEELKEQAAAEHIGTSALVRKILTKTVHARLEEPPLTEERVEMIARRVFRELREG